MLRPSDTGFLIKKTPHFTAKVRVMRLFGNWAISSAKLTPRQGIEIPGFAPPFDNEFAFFRALSKY